MKREQIKNLTLTAMFLALGLVLPFLTGQIPDIGKMLSPMHIPVFLCALVCGWQWATPMAAVLPIMRYFMFGTPNIYPEATAMAFELAAYAFVAGFLYCKIFKKKNLLTVYISLISAMIIGRAVWGCVRWILTVIDKSSFTFALFLTGAFVKAWPGIVLQLVLIPAIMFLLDKLKLVRFDSAKKA